MLPQGYQVIPFFKNIGGLKTRVSPAALDPNAASDLRNVDFDTTFGIKRRNGYTKLNPAMVNELYCVGMFEFIKQNGSRYLVGVWGNKIYKMDNLDGVWDDITGSVSLTSSNTNYVSFAVCNDTLVGTNGVDAPWKWTGAGNASALSISFFTTAKYVVTFKNRLLFLNTVESAVEYTHRVRWSNAGTIETFSGQDYLDILTGGSMITGVSTLYDDVYVFKNGLTSGIAKIYYTGNSDAPFIANTAGEIGAAGGNGICQTFVEGLGSGIIYVGIDRKIRYFAGSYDQPLSDDITPTLEKFNLAKLSIAHAVYISALNQVWFFMAYGTALNKNYALVYDTRVRAFLLHTGMTMNAATTVTNSKGEEVLIAGGYQGSAFTMNEGTTDNGQVFSAFYKTGWIDLQQPTTTKKFGILQMFFADLGENNDMTISYDFDFEAGTLISSTFSLAGGGDRFPVVFPFILADKTVVFKSIRLYSPKPARAIRFTVSAAASTDPWILYGFAVTSKQLGVKEISE